MKKSKIHVDTGLQVNWTFGTKVEDKPDTEVWHEPGSKK